MLTHCCIGISFNFVYVKYTIFTFEMPNVTYHTRFIPRRQRHLYMISLDLLNKFFSCSVTLLVLVIILHPSFIRGFKSVTQPLVVQVIYFHLRYQYKISWVQVEVKHVHKYSMVWSYLRQVKYSHYEVRDGFCFWPNPFLLWSIIV